jgi:iron complex outermembrane recepter protein
MAYTVCRVTPIRRASSATVNPRLLRMAATWFRILFSIRDNVLLILPPVPVIAITIFVVLAQAQEPLVVNVTTPAIPLSPISDSMNRTEIQNRDALTVKEAIDYLPGVSIDHKAPRNQSGISIGGFDSRQVPLYQDGIPVYLPFDGYVDLARYLTSGTAEVQVAKGYSSSLLGPNVLGGVINLVTREPQSKIEGDASLGTGSGNLLNSGLNAGSRWRRFFLQGSADRLQSRFYPLSGGSRRLNSYQRDERFRVRTGWTPNSRDSYAFSYGDQKGHAGDPPYAGSAPVCPAGNAALTFPCVTPKYWKWPYWNTDNYTFNSTTALGNMSSVQFRAFYARFPNSMEMFDDAGYSTMNRNSSSGTLKYDDRSAGASGEFATRVVTRNAIGASFFVKNDTHNEQTTTFSAASVPAATPRQTDRDRLASFGLQDIVTFSSKIRATAGFSADHLSGLQAQDLSSDKTHAVPFPMLDRVWAYNPVGSLAYTTGEQGTFFATFAQKSRFPTLRDRYSYKAGRAIPNPTLRPEQARNWTAGYSRTFGGKTVAQIDFFRSDVHSEIENVSFASRLQAVNVGSEVHQGIDFLIRSTAIPHMTLDANYGYLNRNISGAPGVFPTGTPRHKTVGTAVVKLPHGAAGILSARYESGIVAMSDNNLPLPAAKFGIADVGGTIPIHRGMLMQAGVKNLFDRNYYYWEGFPEAGRDWYMTLRYVF